MKYALWKKYIKRELFTGREAHTEDLRVVLADILLTFAALEYIITVFVDIITT